MKNKEKFAKDILEIACNGDAIAVSKTTGKPNRCGNVGCEDCMRYTGRPGCAEKHLREWAESEYIEKPVISKRDRAFLDYLNVDIYYIARDMGGDLYVYISKPLKLIICWKSSESEASKSLRMFNVDLPMVKWSDSEPWLIEDLKKLEVVDDYE